MSTFTFNCQHCGQSLEAPNDMLGEIIDCPSCGIKVELKKMEAVQSDQPRIESSPAQSQTVETNVKQGALIGAIVCFALGIILMLLSLWSFIIYSPLFLASFILSIVAMSQKRITGGIIILLLTLIVPPVLFLGLSASRGGKALEEFSDSMEEAGIEMENAWEKAEYESITSKIADLEKRKYEANAEQSILNKISVSEAKFYWSDSDFMSQPTIDFKVRNDTGQALSRLYFRGIVSSPGRTIAWVDEDFNYTIQGGIESGEEKHLKLSPNSYGPWGNSELKSRTDLQFEVMVINASDANDENLTEEFGKFEEDRLKELKKEKLELEEKMRK